MAEEKKETLTHWKKLTNPLYMGAHDFQPGQEITAQIESVGREQVTGEGNKKEECTIIRFVGGKKPWIMNKTNGKIISRVVGTPYIEQWPGHKITLYVANNVKAFGEVVDAVRVKAVTV